MSRQKSKKKPITKVPVYLTEQEYAAVVDMAAANNISPGKCLKVAGLQKINEVYAEVAERMRKKANESIDDSNSDSPDSVCDAEGLEGDRPSGIDADVPDDVREGEGKEL